VVDSTEGFVKGWRMRRSLGARANSTFPWKPVDGSKSPSPELSTGAGPAAARVFFSWPAEVALWPGQAERRQATTGARHKPLNGVIEPLAATEQSRGGSLKKGGGGCCVCIEPSVYRASPERGN